jgi:hypothetical protein
MREPPGILDAARRVGLELRDGRAGWGVRLGLTAGALAACISAAMLGLGLIELRAGGLRDEHVLIGIAVAAAAWFGLAYRVWSSYRRWRQALRVLAAFGLIWTGAIGLSIFFGEALRNEEFWIAGTLFAAAAASIALIAVAVSGAGRGRPVRGAGGAVCVECPRCGYSMAGLTQTICPECGSAFTLEELIAAQEYELPGGGASPGSVEPAPPLPARPAYRPLGAGPAVTGEPAG